MSRFNLIEIEKEIEQFWLDKQIQNKLKEETNPMKILAIVKMNLPIQLFNDTKSAKDFSLNSPKEIILSEYFL